MLGILKSLYIFVSVSLISCYEKLSSFFWKFSLGKVGKNVLIQKGVKIRNPSAIFIMDDVSIGRNCQLSSEFFDSRLFISDDVHIDRSCVLDFSGGLHIGRHVTISEGVMIETHSHGYNPREKPVKLELVVGNNVWIGARATILPSVSRIGDNSIIGAGSVVTKEVDSNVVVAGNPARVIKNL